MEYQYLKIWVQLLNHPHPRPSPSVRGEIKYSLALWERVGVRGLNLDILSIGVRNWEFLTPNS
jgi:hypothetical protein